MSGKNPNEDPRSECRKYFRSKQRHYSCIRHFQNRPEAEFFRQQLLSSKQDRQIRTWEVDVGSDA